MIRVRYAVPDELDIAGSVQSLQTIAAALLDLTHSDEESFVIIADTNYDPAPYQIALSKLMITKAYDRIIVTVEDQSLLHISGASEYLDTLAAWFLFDPNTLSKTHVHFEYYENHPLIAPTSMPLVIQVE